MFKLDVSKVAVSEKKADDAEVNVTFELPNGVKDQIKFRRELTVGYLKVQLEKKHKIPYGNQEMVLNGQILADPMSLIDYEAIKKASHITIVVNNTNNSASEDDDHKGGQHDDDQHDNDDDDDDVDDVDLIEDDHKH